MAEEAQNGGENGSKVVVTYTAVKSWLVVETGKCEEAVKFYKEAFGAEEVSRVNHTNKRKADQEMPLLVSAELKLASSLFVVSDQNDDASSPVKGSPVSGSLFCLETSDVEAALAKAVEAGAVSEGEITESEGACCGGRVGKLKDPFGNVWVICCSAKKETPSDVAAA